MSKLRASGRPGEVGNTGSPDVRRPAVLAAQRSGSPVEAAASTGDAQPKQSGNGSAQIPGSGNPAFRRLAGSGPATGVALPCRRGRQPPSPSRPRADCRRTPRLVLSSSRRLLTQAKRSVAASVPCHYCECGPMQIACLDGSGRAHTPIHQQRLVDCPGTALTTRGG
jgi:hypothetical protein